MQSQNQDPHDTIRSDADERTPVSPYHPHAGHLSPLARAALANGVAFDDVYAYERARTCDSVIDLALACGIRFEAIADEVLDSMRFEIALEDALARSVLAQGTIEHARLWWWGVL